MNISNAPIIISVMKTVRITRMGRPAVIEEEKKTETRHANDKTRNSTKSILLND